MKSILIVDDVIGEQFGRELDSRGFLAIPYTGGREAIGAIKNGLRYDLALVDLALTDTDGYEVIAVSKQVNPTIPVLEFSAYSYSRVSGCDGRIQKRPNVNEMIRQIKGFLKS